MYPRRRWFQIHLSTMLLMALVAGATMLFRMRVFAMSDQLVQSNWSETNGLSTRLSAYNCVLSASGNLTLMLELRNDSTKPMTIKREQGPYASIDIFDANGKEILRENNSFTVSGSPRPNEPNDYMVLNPGESVGHQINLRLEQRPGTDGLFIRYFWTYFVPIGMISLRADYNGYNCTMLWDKFESKWIPAEQVFRAPLWIGKATAEPIRLFIAPPWTLRRILTNCALVLGIMIPVGFGCEWWIRRRERKATSSRPTSPTPSPPAPAPYS